MFEAVAIMQWLGDRFGVARGLWPAADAPARLEAMAWSTWAYVTYGSCINRLNFASSDQVPAELHSEAQHKRCHADLQELLGLLDARLATRSYLLGDAFSLADLIVGGVITYSTFLGVATDDHRNVKAWLERLHARPAHRAVWSAAA
jgi:GST-like protein